VAFLLNKMQNINVVFYDGACGLCSRFVQFILKNDKFHVFKFAPLQGTTFQKLNTQYSFVAAVDTVILIYNNRVYYKSSAALKIISHLKGPIKVLSVLVIIPAFIRDFVYDFVAKNRKKWFGINDQCQLLPAEIIREKFLE
jgi:predicted DCC family thiol-disulfide oxidoreductase YuxK